MNSLCLPSHLVHTHGKRGARRPAWRASRPWLVRRSPLSRTEALVSRQGVVLRCGIGRSGIKAIKREGDGATPRARLKPMLLLIRQRGTAGTGPVHRIGPADGWCDDATSARYNLPCRAGSAVSHETLMRADALYDYCLVTDHNQRPRVRGAGSAIFVHVARPWLEHPGSSQTQVRCSNPLISNSFSDLDDSAQTRTALSPTEGCLAFPMSVWQRGRLRWPTFLIEQDPRPL